MLNGPLPIVTGAPPPLSSMNRLARPKLRGVPRSAPFAIGSSAPFGWAPMRLAVNVRLP